MAVGGRVISGPHFSTLPTGGLRDLKLAIPSGPCLLWFFWYTNRDSNKDLFKPDLVQSLDQGYMSSCQSGRADGASRCSLKSPAWEYLGGRDR